MVVTGLDRVIKEPRLLSNAGRLGLLYNQASVDSRFRPAAELIATAFPNRLRALFGPQHGVASTEQDNMKETPHSTHPKLGLHIYSLYSRTREPSDEMLEEVDTVLVDLQDVGTRVYTFATTVLYFMQACAKADKEVVILDRPNPINGTNVEGNVLDRCYSSFVGPYPMPMRHGLTLGELMVLYNRHFSVGCRLRVVEMPHWNRNSYFEATGLLWVLPSPNMPTVDTAVVYPGQVLLEGTNLSEGRGTTRPFELFGAPFVDPPAILNALEKGALRGAVLRETEFEPTFNKWVGELCRGFQIHVTDREVFQPYRATLAVLSAVLKGHSDSFRWADPPYEYVCDNLPIDVITGDPRVRAGVESGCSVFDMESKWEEELREFKDLREDFLIYRAVP